MAAIDQDANKYWEALRLPANGWGMHCTRDGMRSDFFMLRCWNTYGREAFDAALEKHHPNLERRKAWLAKTI